MNVIEVKNLVKDYGFGRGVFDISFSVKRGEVFGFLGPNGAGKSTTIRHLMGFSRPDAGSARVLGRESFREYHEILKDVGYIPGEIALAAGLTGREFLDMNMKMRGIESRDTLRRLLDIFELDPAGETKRMSLGVKRKLAIVTAFMGDPDILILDEPTSGLDPVMQEVFIDFIKLQKEEGKTILLSSHMFNEIDATCDRIAIIKDGRIVSEFVANDLRHAKLKTYSVTLKGREAYLALAAGGGEGAPMRVIKADEDRLKLTFECEDGSINEVISRLAKAGIVRFKHRRETLEDYFMSYYAEDKDFGGTL